MQEMLPNLVILKYIWHSICNAFHGIHGDSINEHIYIYVYKPFSKPFILTMVFTGNSFHPLIQGSQASSELRQFSRCRCTWGGAGCRGLCGAVDVSKRKLFEPKGSLHPKYWWPPPYVWGIIPRYIQYVLYSIQVGLGLFTTY